MTRHKYVAIDFDKATCQGSVGLLAAENRRLKTESRISARAEKFMPE